MKIFIFGNSDVESDSLPLKILPQLRQDFPQADFWIADPNEDFEPPENAIIIDTVEGIKEPKVFNSIDEFEAPPHLTLHDFDLYSHLQFLKKTGHLPQNFKIIGLPQNLGENQAREFIDKNIN